MLKLRSWLSSIYLSLPPLLSQLSALLLFFCFSSVIVYMFYNRPIREHLPRDLSEPVSSLQEYIYMYILGINIIILILLLWGKYQEYVDEAYEELGVEREVNKLRFWFRLKKKLAESVYDARVKISHTYMRIIYPRWQDEYHRLLIACYIRFNELSDRSKSIYFYTILIIPKLIVAGVFLWDVIVQNELNLFYRVLGLLLIPLVFRFICYNYGIIIHNAMDCIWQEMENDPHRFQGTQEDLDKIVANLNEEYIESVQIMLEKSQQEKDPWYKKIFPKLQEWIDDLHQKDGGALYSYNVRVYYLLTNLAPTLQNLDTIKETIQFRLNLILRLCYIVGWAFIYIKFI